MPSILQKIPVGWQRRKLGDYGFCVRGVSYAPGDLKSSLNADTLPLLRSNNIQEDALDLNHVQIVTRQKVKDEQILRSGDIFICMSNGSRNLVGKNVFISRDVESTIGAFCALYRVNDKKNLAPEFARQIFKSEQYYYQVGNALSGTSINNLKNSDIENLTFDFPPVDEQEKIAAILVSVDDEVRKTDEIISATEKLRTGLMVDFFVEEARRKKENKYTFKDVLESVIDHRGLTPKKLGGDWSSQGVPTISAMNVKNGSIVKPDEIRFVDENLYKKWMPEEIHEGDVLLTSEAPLGQSYIVKAGERFCLSQRLFGLRTNRKMLSGEYLYYFLTSPIGQKRLFDRATGSTAKGIRQTELLKVEINPPGLLRQKEIGSILASVDAKISVNQIIKEKLEILKKGLMADLLSGHVRSIK